MPINVQSPVIQQLFQPTNQIQSAANPYIIKGSLIMFRYSYWIHDPMPLLIVTDYIPGQKIRGLNLHYLSDLYIRSLISQATVNPGAFSYQNNIKGNAYIKSSFRVYKWPGISQIKKFDSQFVLKMMSVARTTFDPAQIKAIRQYVDQQIQQQLVGKAEETPEMPYQST